MKKKEVILLIAAVLLFCTGAVTMVFKTAVKSAAHVLETAFPGTVKASGSEIVEDTIDLSEFNDLKLDVASIHTYIEPGDGYKLEYRVREEYVPKVDQRGDKLVIKQPSHFGISFGSLFKDEEEFYRLTVPKDAGIFDVDIEAASGAVNIENIQMNGKVRIASGAMNIQSIGGDELEFSASSGNINLDNISTKVMKLDITSGNLAANKCVTGKLEAEMTSGDMEFDDIKFDKGDFDLTSGSVKASVLGKESDYSYNIDSTSGRVDIGGNNYKGKYKSGDDKDHMITVDMTSGNVDISFSE